METLFSEILFLPGKGQAQKTPQLLPQDPRYNRSLGKRSPMVEGAGATKKRFAVRAAFPGTKEPPSGMAIHLDRG
jgi:hypothetical protein